MNLAFHGTTFSLDFYAGGHCLHPVPSTSSRLLVPRRESLAFDVLMIRMLRRKGFGTTRTVHRRFDALNNSAKRYKARSVRLQIMSVSAFLGQFTRVSWSVFSLDRFSTHYLSLYVYSVRLRLFLCLAMSVYSLTRRGPSCSPPRIKHDPN